MYSLLYPILLYILFAGQFSYKQRVIHKEPRYIYIPIHITTYSSYVMACQAMDPFQLHIVELHCIYICMHGKYVYSTLAVEFKEGRENILVFISCTCSEEGMYICMAHCCDYLSIVLFFGSGYQSSITTQHGKCRYMYIITLYKKNELPRVWFKSTLL